MSTHQFFFESSQRIDVGTVKPGKSLDLRNESDCDQEKAARMILDELRKRLRAIEGRGLEMSQESKQRLTDLLSKQ